MATTMVPQTEAGAERPAASPSRRRSDTNWWLTALLVFVSLGVLLPLYFAVVTALKTPTSSAAPGSRGRRRCAGRTSPMLGSSPAFQWPPSTVW